MKTTPYILTPKDIGNKSLDALKNYIQNHLDEIYQKMLKNGAVLFRGFDIAHAIDFENIAQLLDKDLKNDYLGTSPRNIIEGTQYVFSASELPPYYPIMQHCEMSFLPTAPRRIMFYCNVAPQIGGETPICDFRQVAKSLNPDIKKELSQRRLKLIRNYCAPGNEKNNSFQLKPWVDMFQTRDKSVVEQKCAANQISVEWLKDDALRLVSTHDVFKIHPISKEEVWFNHIQVFHSAAAAIEYSKIARRQHSFEAWKINIYLQLITFIKRYTENPMERAMHITYADGQEIPIDYVQHIQDIIWDNMYFLKWEKGDVIILDNFSTAHGRMPYKGPREIFVSWTS